MGRVARTPNTRFPRRRSDSLWFRGVCEYVKDLVSQIDARPPDFVDIQ